MIHRDVKPANVLFKDVDNVPWLSDFGICLLSDAERVTETSEVAGPWAFMAPEVESGGRLDISNAADVYSLGKLIFYMLSGGVVLSRERFEESSYTEVFSRGGRYHLLDLLLRRMICSLDQRIQNMTLVEDGLQRVIDWDRTSAASPLSRGAFARIEALQRAAGESKRASDAENSARQAAEALARLIPTVLVPDSAGIPKARRV